MTDDTLRQYHPDPIPSPTTDICRMTMPADSSPRDQAPWSPTTSKHINRWLGSVQAEKRPQELFDNLLTVNVNK